MRAEVEDTFAEAFRSIYAEVLVTARDRQWLDHAVYAATGNASSTILCDCEAGLDRYVGPGGDEATPTPDGRPGAVLQFHVPRFRKDREKALERSLLIRISQNVLTCPTTACFNLSDGEGRFPLGRKLAYFGDGFQYRDERFGRRVWVVPIMAGEFVIERDLRILDLTRLPFAPSAFAELSDGHEDDPRPPLKVEKEKVHDYEVHREGGYAKGHTVPGARPAVGDARPDCRRHLVKSLLLF